MGRSTTWIKISTLALAGLASFSALKNISANAESGERSHPSSKLAASSVELSSIAQDEQAGPNLPQTDIYALGAGNVIYSLVQTSTGGTFKRLGRVTNLKGNLIGIDTRPVDKGRASIYGLTDQGGVYFIPIRNLVAGLISNMTTRFAGGNQSLLDFNPVVDAIRLIGGNDQNVAIVNGPALLDTTAVQTSVTYAAGDVNAAVNPTIVGGAYTNNFVRSRSTIFYAFDTNLDTLATIAAPLSATGSSNTGGGIFRTIGRLVNSRGTRVNLAPDADLDIYTEFGGRNVGVGISGSIVFTLDVDQYDPNQPPGTRQNVVIGRAFDASPADVDLNLIDIAVRSRP